MEAKHATSSRRRLNACLPSTRGVSLSRFLHARALFARLAWLPLAKTSPSRRNQKAEVAARARSLRNFRQFRIQKPPLSGLTDCEAVAAGRLFANGDAVSGDGRVRLRQKAALSAGVPADDGGARSLLVGLHAAETLRRRRTRKESHKDESERSPRKRSMTLKMDEKMFILDLVHLLVSIDTNRDDEHELL